VPFSLVEVGFSDAVERASAMANVKLLIGLRHDGQVTIDLI